ncbi:ABC transporter ATP-binding protein [Candidatus Enterovibrio escicola]|uniref:ABC transporter ATP-binding protein n=1 Tax=Candidatus Enterovibrio escicola TaxID=1927127 RepID=UPI001238168D|nr:ABC transporter ATP-binding protein [Candidatus Enterovibrio escacola]
MFKLFFKFIEKHGKKYKFRILLVLLSSIIAASLEVIGIALLYPLITVAMDPTIIKAGGIMSQVYNFLGFTSTKSFLVFISSCVGFSFILKNIYMLIQQSFQFNLIRDWRTNICHDLMRHYICAPMTFHLKKDSTSIINNLTSVVSRAVNSYLIQIIMLISNSAVCFALISVLLLKFPTISIFTGILVISLIVVQMKVIRKITNAINVRYVTVNQENLKVLTMAISGVKDTKILGKENIFLERYNKLNMDVSELDKNNMLVQYIPIYLSEAILMLGVVVFISYVIINSNNPADGIASIAMLAAIAIRISPMINRVLYCYSQIKSSTNSVETILSEFELVGNMTDKHYKTLEFKRSIRFECVGFQYKKKVEGGINNVNIEINSGEFIGIVGKSGAGKTTFVDVLSGLIMKDKGTIYIDDKEYTSMDFMNIRNSVSYVSQAPFILNSSLINNIAFGVSNNEIIKSRVIKAVKKSGLDELVDKHGLDYQLGENGKNLSGGQKQRVAIARALYFDRRIIILDEATSSLDATTESDISNVILSLKGSRTIIIVAHRLSTLKYSDRLLFFKNGTIVSTGTFEELCSKDVNFSKMVMLSKF